MVMGFMGLLDFDKLVESPLPNGLTGSHTWELVPGMGRLVCVAQGSWKLARSQEVEVASNENKMFLWIGPGKLCIV